MKLEACFNRYFPSCFLLFLSFMQYLKNCFYHSFLLLSKDSNINFYVHVSSTAFHSTNSINKTVSLVFLLHFLLSHTTTNSPSSLSQSVINCPRLCVVLFCSRKEKSILSSLKCKRKKFYLVQFQM